VLRNQEGLKLNRVNRLDDESFLCLLYVLCVEQPVFSELRKTRIRSVLVAAVLFLSSLLKY